MESTDITIVLAEDDDGHALLVQKNLERAGVVGKVLRVRDGQEVLDLVAGLGRQSDPEALDQLVLLLDINMPKVDGIEVLRRLKADKNTSTIPVIMLSTTDEPREVCRCYELGCNLYISKPLVYESFVEAITRLGKFLEVVRVPPRAVNPL